MSLPRLQPDETAAVRTHGCWNRIGVHGDSSCAELAQHIHCRNCPVYTAAAASLLDVEPPRDYLAQWTQQAAQQHQPEDSQQISVVIFRVGGEWLALPTPVLREIVSVRTIHSLPHRRSAAAIGLANIRGELLPCFALRTVLGLEQATDAPQERQRAIAARFLVLRLDAQPAVCPVDEVHGIVRFRSIEVKPAPATVSRATVAYTRAVLPWQSRTVGLLDEQLLVHTLNRSLA
jgi:chemotaxis-related protein WspD